LSASGHSNISMAVMWTSFFQGR